MSLDQAKAAINKIKTDNAFREEIMAVSDVGKRVELLNKRGFQCTMAEIEHLTTPDLGFDLKCGEMVMPLTCPDVKT
ncbi:Nif11-like leader peptide family natural product precursor [Prosthecochloris marina]|uniref:Nif11-like leader peptide family natural product n=1 Tax=Prosthecochloris marina TaxID=2017681 RepID=A0A317T981_9CHLB|nr:MULTISPECIES: Nif11-like leader peptide family RiPP precursor [Prosthecochloris]PWW81976.1 Nif11-like leader peptide family natural product precursor [Prosthecochloris marina]UZJ39574.1 Nif11-like leader peptide family natural product precursor [Prosthecochloris sp. SCSIO W1102]